MYFSMCIVFLKQATEHDGGQRTEILVSNIGWQSVLNQLTWHCGSVRLRHMTLVKGVNKKITPCNFKIFSHPNKFDLCSFFD